jgi:four helix bundle protein
MMSNFQQEFKIRTKRVGLEVIKLIDELPNKPSSWEISKQVIRSATSVGANYRAACRAKSNADFIYKLKVVEEEADETLYWLEILEESGLLSTKKVKIIKSELDEIISILLKALITLKSKAT